jgi:hypothetical protein
VDGGASSRPDIGALKAERDLAIDRTQQIIAHAEELRDKVQKARDEIAKKKAALNKRRQELASASNGLEAKRARQTEDVDKSTRMAKYKWNQVHNVTASSRGFLCGEAAKLYGLRRVRKNGNLEEYKIGGIGIIDLRSMNSKSRLLLLSHVTNSTASCKPSSNFNSLITHCASLDAIYALPGNPSTRRNHTSTP